VSRGLPLLRTGIVVGLQDHREADRIVRLLTPENGRITVLARSARKSNRRFGGALDIGNRIEATLRPPRGDWWGIDSATLVDGRPHARKDLELIGLLAYSAEVCGTLAREDHPEPKLFGLLDMTLSLINAMSHAPSPLFRLGFEAKALTFAGVGPEFTRCVACRGPLDGNVLFSTVGAQHQHCADHGTMVELKWLQAVEQARRTPLRESIDSNPPTGPRWVLAEAIEAHLGRNLRSRSVLATLSP
jgi:DNA repair protein RecO (recombination protein O)